jgi:hypothetical protein
MSKTVAWGFSNKQKKFLKEVLRVLEDAPFEGIYLTVKNEYNLYSITDVKNWITHLLEERNSYDRENREILNAIRTWYIKEIKLL